MQGQYEDAPVCHVTLHKGYVTFQKDSNKYVTLHKDNMKMPQHVTFHKENEDAPVHKDNYEDAPVCHISQGQ